jgi:hypothetical protein
MIHSTTWLARRTRRALGGIGLVSAILLGFQVCDWEGAVTDQAVHSPKTELIKWALLGGAIRLKFLHKGLPASGGGGGGPPAAVIYDDTVGQGVDANGFANTPLRAGARYIFVGAGGNDANDGLTHPTRRVTIAAGRALIRDSFGDQLLIAEGGTYAEGMPNLQATRGFSAAYPTVIQTYDPADPTNTAKYGKAVHPNRPVLDTGDNVQDLVGGGGGSPDKPPNNLIIRGLVWQPSVTAGISFIPGASVYIGQVIFENCILRGTGVAIQNNGQYGYAGIGGWIIFRNCSLYGEWSPTGDGAGVYIDGCKHVTLEDSVWVRNGYRMGANRDDSKASGGCMDTLGRRHAWYLQEDCNTTLCRRNIIIDPANDSGQNRSASLQYDNVIIDSPIAAAIGSGAAYWITKPRGVDLAYIGNLIIGDADITSVDPRRWLITTCNGTPISEAYGNIATASYNIGGINNTVFNTTSLSPAVAAGVPSFMNYSNNYAPNRTTNMSQVTLTGALSTATFDHNVWDLPTSGTNLNGATVTPTHSYQLSDFLTAFGYANKDALVTYVINHPEAHVSRQFLSMGRAGYGNTITLPGALRTLKSTIKLVRGLDDGSVFIGAFEGLAFSSISGAPPGTTLHSTTATWHYDPLTDAGTGDASGTWRVRATKPDGTFLDSDIPWSIKQPAVLSGAGIDTVGSTTATMHVSSDKIGGSLSIVIDAQGFNPADGMNHSPGWWHGRRYDVWGNNSTNGVYTAATNFKTQTVTATGLQAISATGLTSGKTYYVYAVQSFTSPDGIVVSQAIDIGNFTTS